MSNAEHSDIAGIKWKMIVLGGSLEWRANSGVPDVIQYGVMSFHPPQENFFIVVTLSLTITHLGPIRLVALSIEQIGVLLCSLIESPHGDVSLN
jgi:hypothetical protein